jgi:hypothetical protein
MMIWITQSLGNNTPVIKVMKTIGFWFNTDGSWLELYGTTDPNLESIYL